MRLCHLVTTGMVGSPGEWMAFTSKKVAEKYKSELIRCGFFNDEDLTVIPANYNHVVSQGLAIHKTGNLLKTDILAKPPKVSIPKFSRV